MMAVVFALLGAVCLVVIAVNLYACYLLRNGKDTQHPLPANLPYIAILIAARNEEHNLPRCLHALEQLDYPAEKLSIWIGNDDSSDKTAEIAAAWCRQGSRRFLVDIQEEVGQARGKANVLAQLARQAAAEADYYFMTDADVAVQPSWLREMLVYFRPDRGVVSGSSVIEGEDGNALLQRYDWALGLGLAKAFTYFPVVGQTLTAIGNNMAVSRKAYEEAGGYENIPFSITEDYELHRQLNRIGYRSLQVAGPGTKAYTLPGAGGKALLHQRKRWMHGAMELPKAMVAILFMQALFFPAILVVLFHSPLWGLGLLLAKLLSQALLIRYMLQRLNEPPAFPFLGYEIYSLLLNVSLIVFYFMPVPVNWKGRTY